MSLSWNTWLLCNIISLSQYSLQCTSFKYLLTLVRFVWKPKLCVLQLNQLKLQNETSPLLWLVKTCSVCLFKAMTLQHLWALWANKPLQPVVYNVKHHSFTHMVYVVKQTTSGYVQAINYLVGFGFLTLTFSGSLSFWLTVLPVNRLYTSTSILFWDVSTLCTSSGGADAMSAEYLLWWKKWRQADRAAVRDTMETENSLESTDQMNKKTERCFLTVTKEKISAFVA